jgi:FAD/FMN-containing dehydrogenase
MGRGVLVTGRWASPEEAPGHPPKQLPRVTVPFVCPEWVMGRTVGRIVNAAIYGVHSPRPRAAILHPEPFFYPLDLLRQWNRLYGRGGFTQHQCVLPEDAGPGAVRNLVELLTRLGVASFLCVIKDCGDEGEGLLSFPRRGVSIALDMPIRPNTQAIIDTLNAFVIGAGGRIYLTKDTFTRADDFRRMEPRLGAFDAIRRRWDPARTIRSAQSERLFGDRS